MSIGKQTVKEILDEIETEFFKRLSIRTEGPVLGALANEIKLDYQRSVTKALADYLEKNYFRVN